MTATSYLTCSLCSARTASVAFGDEAALEEAARELGFRELPEVAEENRRRFSGWLCRACVVDVSNIDRRLPMFPLVVTAAARDGVEIVAGNTENGEPGYLLRALTPEGEKRLPYWQIEIQVSGMWASEKPERDVRIEGGLHG